MIFPSITPNGCWQSKLGDIHMGCTLDSEEFNRYVKLARSLKQVHGTTILTDKDYRHCEQSGDGLFSRQQDVALVVRTADCVPVHATDGEGMLMLHAGWRGTRSGLIKRLPEFLNPRNTKVVIGPSIHAENYEVDRDFYEPWLEQDPKIERWLSPQVTGTSKRRFDLRALVSQQLRDVGVGQVQMVPVCTFASTLPSYRREKNRKRSIYNYMYLKP